MDVGEGRRPDARWDRLVRTTVVGLGAPSEQPDKQPHQGWSPDRASRAILDDIAEASIAYALALALSPVATLSEQHAPEPPPAALQRLRHDYRALAPYLREWLVAAADLGYRAPPEDVPLLRSLVADDPSCAIPAARFAGRVGWDLADPPPAHPGAAPRSLFRTGSPANWEAYLKALRVWEPDRARELLATEWWRPWDRDLRRVNARQRRTLLRTLAVNLSLADEPFLEAVLGGRIKLASVAAAKLLARLPGSAFGERMARRAFACVELSKNGFDLVRPAEPETVKAETAESGIAASKASARRDRLGSGLGLVAHTTSYNQTSERTALLEILSATPLQAWERRFGLTPRLVVERAGRSDPVLRHGLYLAILRQRDPGWALEATRDPLFGNDVALMLHSEDLARLLPGMELGNVWLYVLAALPVPWPDPAAQLFWSEIVRRGGGHVYVAESWIAAFARGLPLRFEPEVRARIAEFGGGNNATRLRPVLDAFAYRRAMLAELSELLGPAEPA